MLNRIGEAAEECAEVFGGGEDKGKPIRGRKEVRPKEWWNKETTKAK